MTRHTTVSIVGEDFHINGQPTYAGRTWRGHRVEGLLLNSRMVQGIFDDLNPETRSNWDYPDGPWDPERNTREFLEQMPTWREHGMLAFTINFQGGSPRGYSQEQPWHNSSYHADGTLRPEFTARLERILDRADELGMAVIVGYFYFGQDERLTDEHAVLNATDQATDWLIERGYRHVMVEVNNECNVHYDHAILQPERVHELIERVQRRSEGKLDTPAGRLLVSTSYTGQTLPKDNVIGVSDYVLLHGNGVHEPARMRTFIDATRALPGYRGQPIFCNEDDHYAFDEADNNLIASVEKHVSWGLFDYRFDGEGFEEGYQSVPTDWGIRSDRKRGFFRLLREITGA